MAICNCGKYNVTRAKPPSAVNDENTIYRRIREIAREEGKTPTIDKLGAHDAARPSETFASLNVVWATVKGHSHDDC